MEEADKILQEFQRLPSPQLESIVQEHKPEMEKRKRIYEVLIFSSFVFPFISLLPRFENQYVDSFTHNPLAQFMIGPLLALGYNLYKITGKRGTEQNRYAVANEILEARKVAYPHDESSFCLQPK